MSDFEKYTPVPPIKARADDAKRAVCMKIRKSFDTQLMSEKFRKENLRCRSIPKSSKS